MDRIKLKLTGPIFLADDCESAENQEEQFHIGVTVPGTENLIAIVSDAYGYGNYWHFVATKSGVKIPVWAETEDVKKYLNQRTGGHVEEWPFLPQDFFWALAAAGELYKVAKQNFVPLESSDQDLVSAALRKLTFVDTDDGIICRLPKSPKQPRKRVTQKILDSGSDMTH